MRISGVCHRYGEGGSIQDSEVLIKFTRMTPFSLRHRTALLEGRIRVSLPWRVRNRLWITMDRYNESYYYRPDPNDGWTKETTLIAETERELLRLLGFQRLTISIEKATMTTDLENYFKKGYPSNVLDVLEQFFLVLRDHAPDYRTKAWEFQHQVNESMADFECPWRLSDGLFFKIETEFLDREIVQKAEDQLRQQGFSGALDEFRAARDDLSGAEYKDAILKAAQSVESTLKIITECNNGDIGKLMELFHKGDFLDDIPLDKQKAIAKTISQGLAVLRNELGGHGQGGQKVTVERPYAALAVHLAGALTQFAIDQYLRKQPPPPQRQTPKDPDPDLDAEPDDIPF